MLLRDKDGISFRYTSNLEGEVYKKIANSKKLRQLILNLTFYFKSIIELLPKRKDQGLELSSQI